MLCCTDEIICSSNLMGVQQNRSRTTRRFSKVQDTSKTELVPRSQILWTSSIFLWFFNLVRKMESPCMANGVFSKQTLISTVDPAINFEKKILFSSNTLLMTYDFRIIAIKRLYMTTAIRFGTKITTIIFSFLILIIHF